MLLIIGVLLIIRVLLVATLAELDGVDRIDCIKRRNSFVTGCVDHIQQALFEVRTVHDQCIGRIHGDDLLRRCLKVMRIGANRHDGDDLCRITHDGLHNVSEDIGGDHDRRQRHSVRQAGSTIGDRRPLLLAGFAADRVAAV